MNWLFIKNSIKQIGFIAFMAGLAMLNWGGMLYPEIGLVWGLIGCSIVMGILLQGAGTSIFNLIKDKVSKHSD